MRMEKSFVNFVRFIQSTVKIPQDIVTGKTAHGYHDFLTNGSKIKNNHILFKEKTFTEKK